MTDTLSYTQNNLLRAAAAHHRDDWIAEQLEAPETLIVPIWRTQNLIASMNATDSPPQATLVSGERARAIVKKSVNLTFLGLRNDKAVFAADLTALSEDSVGGLINGSEFIDLRTVGRLMNGSDASLLAYARGIIHWHNTHLFCGTCGSPTSIKQGGHLRLCSNPDTPHPTFPRTDPAVIMLVTDNGVKGGAPRCLLGRHSKWIQGNYSTLAGFVEPGESLEAAVTREVLEEAGIHVTDVTYKASQPWPFPSSLMLGFRALGISSEIILDEDELQDAQWFTADEVHRFKEWGEGDDEGKIKCLPRHDSISRWLIEDWLSEQT